MRMTPQTPLTAEQYEAALALAQRRLQRIDRAREQAELMLDLRSRALSIANANLRRRESELLLQLEQDAQRLIAAQETAQMASFHVENSERVVGSPNLSEIVGAPQAIATLSDMISLIHPLEGRGTQDFLRGGALPSNGRQRDIRFIERTGGTRWLRWNIRPASDSGGGYQGVVRDITENRKLNRQVKLAEILRARQFAKLQRVSTELAEKSRMLSERVAELEALGANLKEARNRAISADRSKSQFLAMMSHDIRTPMNAILAVVDILATTQLSAEQEKWLNLIRISGEQMLFLLSDIIEVARNQEIDVKLQEYPLDLPEFLTNIVDTWRPRARARGLELYAKFPDDIQNYIIADAIRLRQVFDNLISNAVKYTPDGFITFTASANCGQSHCKMEFSISDTGGGISGDQIGSIFEVGHRVTTDLNEFVQGSGLGLAICSNIIKAMSGEIRVQSTVNIGSTFTVILPCKVCSLAEYAAYRAANAPSAPNGERQNPLHILVAEDVEANRIIVGGLLDKLGHSYDLVDDGIAALEAVSAHHYDLILMDVQMPRLNGMKATQAIRVMNGPIATAPIIGLTAFVADAERAAMMAAGMTAIVSKPVRLSSLAKAIEENNPYQRANESIYQDAEQAYDHSVTEIIDLKFFTEQISVFPIDRQKAFVASMITDIHRLKKELSQAYIDNDEGAQGRAKHSFKGLCYNFGLNMLAACVEQFGEQPTIPFNQQLVRLETIAARTITAIGGQVDQPQRRYA